MVALVVLATAAVGALTYRNIAALALPRALERLDDHAYLLGSELAASVRGARADVVGFRSAVALADIMTARLDRGTDPAATAAEAAARRRMAERYAVELAAKPNYYAFRILGAEDGGREIVRVDRSGPDGAIRIAPDDALRREGDRAASIETIRAGAPARSMSRRSNLSRRNGEIATPHVPVIRIATPIHTPDGKPFGIVSIKVDMRSIFSWIRSNPIDDGRSYVVNDQGGFLVDPDQDLEFGFVVGRPAHIQDEFPDLLKILASGDTTPRVMQDRAGHRFGVGLELLRLADGPRIAVDPGSAVCGPDGGDIERFATPSLLAGLGAAFFAFLLAVVVARSLTRPLVQMTRAVDGFSRGETIALPTGGGQEIGALTAAFAEMAARVARQDGGPGSRRSRSAVAPSRNCAKASRWRGTSSPMPLKPLSRPTTPVAFWNGISQAEAIFGWSRQEALGQHLPTLLVSDALQPYCQEMKERAAAQRRRCRRRRTL